MNDMNIIRSSINDMREFVSSIYPCIFKYEWRCLSYKKEYEIKAYINEWEGFQ
jgi:hypothetical protein